MASFREDYVFLSAIIRKMIANETKEFRYSFLINKHKGSQHEIEYICLRNFLSIIFLAVSWNIQARQSDKIYPR